MALLIGSTWRDDLVSAMNGVQSLQASYPGDTALLSAERQLTYLLALTDDVENDDVALEEINVGYLAMYQLVDILPPELAELLSELNDRVRRHLRRQGRTLKIDQR